MQEDGGNRPIRAMVVDDAAFMRKALVEILSKSEDIDVVGVAKHGKEAIEAIKELKPDVITLDVDMPIMDGLTTIKHIMVRDPMPIVMVSGLADQGKITFEALSLGAVDFFPKPSGTVSHNIHESGNELIDTLRVAASINPRAIKRALKKSSAAHRVDKRRNPAGLVVVVAFQGAASSFIRLASAVFPLLDAACICIQDMSISVLSAYAKELDRITGCAKAVEPGESLQAGCCGLLRKQDLPGISRDESGRVYLEKREPPSSLSQFLKDAANVFGEDVHVCILGGQASEDLSGFEAVNEKGGCVVALVPEKCASGELAEKTIDRGIAVPFDSEQAIWTRLNAFSRQMTLKSKSGKH